MLEGLSNAAEDTLQSLAELNPLRMLEDPSAWVEDVTRYAAGVGQLGQGLMSDPLGTLDDVFTGGAIGRGQPGVAVGEFAGGILAGGIAGKLTKLGKLDALTDPADDNRRDDDDDDSPGAADRRRSDADQFGAQISQGHSFLKHVILRGEFPGIRTRAEFSAMLENVILHGESKPLDRGRTGYWLDGVVAVINPADPDGGTAFAPNTGRTYFDDLE